MTCSTLSEFRNADKFQQLHRPLADFRFFTPRRLVMEHRTEQSLMGAHMASYHDVLQCCHLAEQTDVLESSRDAGLRHLVRRRW
ncbi:hypothetical protein D3C81_2189780 [compost metagenome]